MEMDDNAGYHSGNKWYVGHYRRKDSIVEMNNNAGYHSGNTYVGHYRRKDSIVEMDNNAGYRSGNICWTLQEKGQHSENG